VPSLAKRREWLTKQFISDMSNETNCLHELLPAKWDSDVTGKLRDVKQYLVPWAHTERFDLLIYVRVCTITAIWTVGHRLKSTPTNGHRFTALILPWRSTHPSINRARSYLTSVTEAPSKHWLLPPTWGHCNININICSIELKWDDRITKIWYDKMRWIRITVLNGGDL